jgi:myosin heavy subunit
LKEFDFLKNTNHEKVKTVDDVECYKEVVEAFQVKFKLFLMR